MKIPVKEDETRRIANREHNVHVANGIDQHKATQLAPSSFFEPFSEKLESTINSRHLEVVGTLSQVIGEPYFEDTGFILYEGDSTTALAELARTRLRLDLAVTSPPYNIGKEYEAPMPVEEYATWCSHWMDLIYRILKDDGAFWLNLGYLEVPEKGLCVPIPYLVWNRSPFYLLQEVVWKYGAGVSTKHRLSPRNEKWLFYIKRQKEYTFNLDDIRDPNVKYPNQKKNGEFRCNPLGKNPSDVWEFPKVTTGRRRSSRERTGHPAQFPLAIMERIIKASSNPGEVVIDPFAGSASAGIAAYGLGRIFVGFEINSDYCRMATDRFRQFKIERKHHKDEPTLF